MTNAAHFVSISAELREAESELAATRRLARAMLAALEVTCSELDPLLHNGRHSRAYTAARAAIAAAKAAGIGE